MKYCRASAARTGLRLSLGLLLVSAALGPRVHAQPASEEAPLARVGEVVITTGQVQRLVDSRWNGRVDGATGTASANGDRRSLKSAALLGLVRRQLALERLRQLGGETLESSIQRQISQRLEARRRREPTATLSLAEEADVAWEVAWSEYLGRHMTEENLQRFFEARRWRYDGTRILLAQVFLPHAGGAGGASPEETLRRIRQRIEQGETSFAAAAESLSESPSATAGGRIGWITADGDVPPEVSEAAFQAEVPSIVGPVLSSLGWHLLSIDQRTEGTLGYSEIEDHASLRRDAADYLFTRLVREAARTIQVEWLEPSLQPPPGIEIAPGL